MRKAAITSGGVVALLLLATVWSERSATARVSVIREHQTTTQLVWNERQAYLFVGMKRDGWSGPPLEYLWYVIQGLVGRSFRFDESRQWLVAVELNTSGVSRVVQDGETFHFVKPFQGQIYKAFGQVQRWTNDGFQVVPEAEASRFNSMKANVGVAYSDRDGWSSRVNLLNQGAGRFEYPLTLDGVRMVLVADRTVLHHPRLLVQIAEGPDAVLLTVDERLKTVRVEEYELLMRGPVSLN